MKIYHSSQRYGRVSHDITNHCNAHCKFCLNDWDMTSPFNMSVEVFKKSRHIISLCHPGCFLFSCLYEPTLHPKFLDFLDMIPFQHKNMVSFTTNLARKLSDEDLARMCNAPVVFFNISLETYRKDRYTFFSGIQNSYFYDNLHRLALIARNGGNHEKLRIITMILRSNSDELLEIIERVQNEIHPSAHELRTPYISHPIENFLRKELLTRKELSDLLSKIQSLGYENILVDTGRSLETFYQYLQKKKRIAASYGIEDQKSDNIAHRICIDLTGLEDLNLPTEFEKKDTFDGFLYQVRINSDGTGYFIDTDEFFDLNQIDDSLMFFSRQLLELERKEASRYVIPVVGPCEVIEYTHDFISGDLEEIIVMDREFLILGGWFRGVHQFEIQENRVILLTSLNVQKGILLRVKSIQRENLPGVEPGKGFWGFSTRISKAQISVFDSYDVFAGYMDGRRLHVRKIGTLPPFGQIV